MSLPQLQTTKCPDHSYRRPNVPTTASYKQVSQPQLQTTTCPNQTTATDNQVPQTDHSYRQPSVSTRPQLQTTVSQPDHSYRQPSVPNRPQLQTTKCLNQTTATDNQVSQPDHSYRQPSVKSRATDNQVSKPELQTTKCPALYTVCPLQGDVWTMSRGSMKAVWSVGPRASNLPGT